MNNLSVDTRVALLRQYGSFSQAYSAAFQPGLSYFGDERGFIAYKTVWRTALVLADPVTSLDNMGDLLARFLSEHPDAMFCQISRPVAEVLASRGGFFINDLGTETRLDLPNYDFSGAKKENFRKAFNRAAKAGYVIKEGLLSSVRIEDMQAVSQAWKRSRPLSSRESMFLIRPLELRDEPDVHLLPIRP